MGAARGLHCSGLVKRGHRAMALFVAFGRFTDQGLRNIKRYPATANAAVQQLPSGVKVHALYMTQGRYDVVSVFECTSQEDAFQVGAQISAHGNTRWETMAAVTVERFEELLTASAGQAGKPKVTPIPDDDRSVRDGWQT